MVTTLTRRETTTAPPPPRRRPQRRTTIRRNAWFTAAVLLAPALLAVLMLRVIPMLGSLETAFAFGSGLDPLANFAYLFSDPNFIDSLRVTLLFSIVVNPLQIALALGLAVLLARRMPAVGLWRALVLLPAAVPQTVSALIWMVFMRPDGPLNAIGAAVGLPPVPWLTSPDVALFSIIIVCSWVGVGFWMTFLITGMKDIPESHYEAASLDGANAWQRFVHITLPGLRRPLLFVLVADTVANLLVFAPVRIMTQGGPGGSTNLVMHYIFETGYTLGDTQTAAAGTLILVAIVIVVTAVQFRLLPGKD
ncbi:carbohydrate ABC transporter permease [Herbiconiux sp. YIM B11900]|uniref:carbohydrate ABC transporter permease n=1 Tax=Herbiconiux sp. YIM B11900 TaxID=3404131 RepID=UPI003F84057B